MYILACIWKKAEKVWLIDKWCKKISVVKENRQYLTILSETFFKLTQQTELQLAAVLAIRKHAKNKVVSSIKAIDQ